MTLQGNSGQANGKNRPHCRICRYGLRQKSYDYQIFWHIERVHNCPLGEDEEWAILERQQHGDDSRCFYHLHASTGAVPLAEVEAKEKKITARYAKRDAR